MRAAFWPLRRGAETDPDFPARYTMATYSTNQFKSGLKIILDGDPYNIVENEFVKPGKGQAFSRVKVATCATGA